MIIFNTMQDKTQSVIFHNDPFVELVASLHVLGDLTHHKSCENWAKKTISRISMSLKNEIIYFATNYAQWLFILDIATALACDSSENISGTAQDFKNTLKRYAQLDEFEFAYIFLGLSAFNIERKTLAGWIESPDNIDKSELNPITVFISENNIKSFLKNINTTKTRLLHIFEEYWDKVFKDEWNHLRQYLIGVAESQKQIASGMSMPDYILNINSDLDIVNNRLMVNKEVDYEIGIDEINNLHVFLSAFTAPHLMMDIRGNELILYYNLDYSSISSPGEVPDEMIEVLKALGDRSRLQILKILWQGGATTQSLSQTLNLAPSTTSVHLKLLKRANLIKSQQIKKYVYYEADKHNLEMLWKELNQYLKS